MSAPLLCRECREAKHMNCDGIAWNNELDESAPCQCSNESHTPSTEVTDRPENSTQLADLIESLTVFDYADGGEGYEKSADAMWEAALAAFNYAARRVGATGFQASWAALRFYGEAMNVRGPFMVVKLEDALYPQYDVVGRVRDFLAEQHEWLRDEAAKKLAEMGEESFVHPNVEARWRKLAGS